MTNLLTEIRKILKSEADAKTRASTKKFVPTVKKIYGVKTPVLNELARNYKNGGFRLIEVLWKSEMHEEQMLAGKILGCVCDKDPDCALNFVKKLSSGIDSWDICDTLASQGIKKIAKAKQKEIFALSEKLALSKNLWQRRFSLVLLINYKKDKKLRSKIKKILKSLERDEEYYVKKAVGWLKREIH